MEEQGPPTKKLEDNTTANNTKNSNDMDSGEDNAKSPTEARDVEGNAASDRPPSPVEDGVGSAEKRSCRSPGVSAGSGSTGRARGTTSTPVKVKQEPKEGDMKDFAETTMNELLGWYGYDKVDEGDTDKLDLQQFTPSSGRGENYHPPGARGENYTPSGGRRALTPSEQRERDNSSRNSVDSIGQLSSDGSGIGSDLAAHHQALVSALNNGHGQITVTKGNGADSPTPTDGSSSPSPGESSTSAAYIICAWCQKAGPKLFTLKTPSLTKAFCSEYCFTQCRRASFKKNKVCDWCKHVRHTVNYVDFQDGEQQLQFCSDKCLSQYKMNIFCKETQEHLQSIQSQVEAGVLPKPPSTNKILITPELWLQQESAKATADGEKTGNKRESTQAESQQQGAPLDLNIKAAVKSISESRRSTGSESKSPHGGSSSRSHPSPAKRIKLETTATSNSSSGNLHSAIDKMKRMKSRDSISTTPLSIAPSPGSVSALSSTPSSGGSTHTPPTVTNGQHPALPPLPFMGALGPGGLLPHHLLYPHLLGLPGGMPPGLLMPTPQSNPTGLTARTGAVSPMDSSMVGSSGRGRMASTPESPPFHTTRGTTNTPGNVTPIRSGSSSTATASAPPQHPTQSQPQPPHPPHTAFGGPRLAIPPGYFPSMTPFGPFPAPPGPGIPPAGFLPPPSVAAANGLIPPATLMVPYPVPIPLPIPVPIVIPVKTDKEVSEILNMYNKKSPATSTAATNSPTTTTGHHGNNRDSTPARIIDIKPIKTETAPLTGHVDPRESSASYTSPASRSGTPRDPINCACCQTPVSDGTSKQCSAQSHCSIDHYPLPSAECLAVTSTSDLEDGVIDLSTDRQSRDGESSSPSSRNHSRGGLPPDGLAVALDQNKNSLCVKPPMGMRSSNSVEERSPSAGVPTSSSSLHMVPTLVPPFVALAPSQLLPLPQESAYSARRGRILDAPSVPRDRNRSPTPERRVMVRGPSREVLFAKRRIMRARIKTK